MAEPLFDDEYTGPRWRYGLTYRPAAGANVPMGFILMSHRQHPEYTYGTIDYPRALTSHEVQAFQLAELGEVQE